MITIIFATKAPRTPRRSKFLTERRRDAEKTNQNHFKVLNQKYDFKPFSPTLHLGVSPLKSFLGVLGALVAIFFTKKDPIITTITGPLFHLLYRPLELTKFIIIQSDGLPRIAWCSSAPTVVGRLGLRWLIL